jgi:hypothetical protein
MTMLGPRHSEELGAITQKNQEAEHTPAVDCCPYLLHPGMRSIPRFFRSKNFSFFDLRVMI